MPAQNFVWYELVTSDIDAASAFYGKILGWAAADFPAGGEERYVIVSANGKGIGGIMALPEGVTHPFWLGYAGTPDIAHSVATLRQNGGKVERPPWEIPGVGQLALVSDPQGAGFALIQGASAQPSQAFDQQLPGHVQWHELRTTGQDAALAFYAAQFGWTKGDAHDMGPMGIYQMIKAGETEIGAIQSIAPPKPSSWLYYFGVESVSSAAAAIAAAGGAVVNGPMPVPGGAHILHGTDPQGALFALVGPA